MIDETVSGPGREPIYISLEIMASPSSSDEPATPQRSDRRLTEVEAARSGHSGAGSRNHPRESLDRRRALEQRSEMRKERKTSPRIFIVSHREVLHSRMKYIRGRQAHYSLLTFISPLPPSIVHFVFPPRHPIFQIRLFRSSGVIQDDTADLRTSGQRGPTDQPFPGGWDTRH